MVTMSEKCRILYRLGNDNPSAVSNDWRFDKEARPVRTSRAAWKRLLIGLCSGVSLIAAAINGCGGSSEVREIPEAAKKSLFQKKAEYEHRSTKSPKGSTSSPRP